MSSGTPETRTGSEQAVRRLSYLLVFLMMVCGVLTIANLIPSIAPGWHAGVVAAILLFIVIDRLYIHRQLRSLTPLSSEWVIAVGAQWIVITVFLRLLLSYANGLESFQADMSLIGRGHLTALFTQEFVFSFVLAALFWYLSGYFLSLLDEMGLDQTLALQEETAHIRSDVLPARQRLLNLIFSMGIVLVVLTALARINLSTVIPAFNRTSALELNRLSGGESGALLYFVFGLALLSLGRLLSLQTRWIQQRIPVSSRNLTRQWAMYSAFFLLFMAVIVSLLPAGDGIGFFSLLGTLLGFLVSILFFIGQLILILLSLLFSLPLLLLRGEEAPTAPEPPPLPIMPPVEPAVPVAANEAWVLIRSILLWGSLGVIIVFAFVQFVRQHGGARAALRRSRVTNWLVLAWQWLYRGADKTRGTLGRAIVHGWQGIVSRLDARGMLPRAELLHLRSLDPRQRIYFFYLAMIRRGAERGVQRKPSQTPAEYAATLERALPSAAEDIDAMTEAFVQARYSRQDMDSRQAEVVKATWRRIRRALQSKSKPESPANDRPK